MIKVKLKGHDYRYEAFQILSLFYPKDQIEFTDGDKYDLESIFDFDSSCVTAVMQIESNNEIKNSLFINSNDKKGIKNAIKMTILKCLERYKKVEIPWGILVGIRPTKIAHEYFSEGYDENQIKYKLTSKYSISQEKADLVLEVAKREAKFIIKPENRVSIYIDIPFCPTRCVYCSFTSNPIGGNERLIEEYLLSLIKEIKVCLKYLNEKGFIVDTVYIGGGTPTSLSHKQLDLLFNALSSCINLYDLKEFTVEAGRPDSITKDKLNVIKNAGSKRISINPQTMNDETLKRVGRMHTSKDIIDKYYMARDIGFDSINMDLIIGLPDEGEKEVKNTMESLKHLSPENITIHTMSLKRASILNEKEHYIKNSTAEAMYRIATSNVLEMGMYPYYMYRQKNMVYPLENVGYCTDGKECIYNIQMISESISIISFGAGAVTKTVFPEENRIERIANVKDVREYINRTDEMIDNKIKAISMLTKL